MRRRVPGGSLYLFALGRYVGVDEPDRVRALADLRGWPTAAEWADGVIDGTVSIGGDQVLVFRAGQWVTFSISAQEVLVGAPQPLSDFAGFTGLSPEVFGPGFRGGFFWYDGTAAAPYTLYSGCDVLVVGEAVPDLQPSPAYPPAVYAGWPDTWNPQLDHAFTGRSGALWSVTRAGRLLSLEADGFHDNSRTAGQVSAGRDGSIYFTDPARTTVYALADPATPVYTSPSPLRQLSHGRAGELWALDGNGDAVRVSGAAPGATVTAQTMFQAQSISANADGSVWHVDPDGSASYYTDVTGGSQALPNAPDATLVASNALGRGYLVSASSASGPESLAVHEYTSPFVFKTVGMPGVLTGASVVNGGGRVFYLTGEWPSNRLIACDDESGEVAWSQVSTATTGWAAMAYSVELGCLVAVSGEAVHAFRASDGFPLQVIPQSGELDIGVSVSVQGTFAVVFYAAPSGAGTCVALDLTTGRIVWSALLSPPPPPSTERHAALTTEWGPAAPIITEDHVFIQTMGCGDYGNGVTIARLDGRGAAADVTPTYVWTDDGSPDYFWGSNQQGMVLAPIYAGQFRSDRALYFVDGGGSIRAISFDGSQTAAVSPGQLIGRDALHPVYVDSPLTYAYGCIWFGGDIDRGHGQLGGLFAVRVHGLTPEMYAPLYPDGGATAVSTKPLAYRNLHGQSLLVFGTEGVAKLWAFNPVDGSFGSIDMMGTEIGAVAAQAPLGVLRCSGSPPRSTPDALTAYYGVRLDDIPLHAAPRYTLVADSQLMQDPDPDAVHQGSTDPENPIPPSVARYQTHLTVVDAGRVPVPFLHLKLYVDQADGVTLTVQGQQVVASQEGIVAVTDAGGKVTVVSDATDVTTVALRVWAPFMDNSERVVVFPDHEFHQRVMTAHADATDTDPATVNLVTAHDYDGTAYFTDAEKDQQVPQQTASTVQRMGTAIGLSPGAPGAAAHSAAGTEPPRYLSYADMGGTHYYPVDTIARRPLPPPQTAFALHVARTGTGLVPAELSLKQAGEVLDGMIGDPWDPPGAAADAIGAAPLGGLWDDFWRWLGEEVQKAADVIQRVVVVVAEEVRVTLQVIEDGVLKVVDFVVTVVEDAVHVIGSLFVALGKLVLRTIEALSVLFHFGEILKTHRMILSLVQSRVLGSAHPEQPGLSTIITAHAVPAVTDVVNTGDAKIKAFIDRLRGELTGAQHPVSQQKGQGATEHTAFQVPPRTGDAGTPTKAVQCSWGSDALKQNLPGATMSRARGAAPGDSTDSLTAFIEGFKTRLETGDLEQTADQLTKDFTNLFHSSSAAQFLDSAVDTLLDLIKLLMESALEIGGGLFEGALGALAEMIGTVWQVVTQPIDLPLLSWLYKQLTGDDLSVLDAGLFVVAIPVTILFEVFTGQYPSQAVAPQDMLLLAAAPGELPPALQMLAGFVSTFATFVGGMITAVNDVIAAASEVGSDLTGPIAVFIAACDIGALATSFPLISGEPVATDYMQFGLSAVGAVPDVFMALVRNGSVTPTSPMADINDVLAVMTVVIGLATIGVAALQIVETEPSYGADFGFAIGIAGAVPQITTALTISVVDTALEDLGSVIAAGVELIETIAALVCGLVLLATDPPTLGGPPAVHG